MSKIYRKGDKLNYINFLKSLKGKDVSVLTFKELVVSGKKNKKSIILRHDVDYNLESAVEIAKAEKKAGFKSTFFLLPPGSYRSLYFDYSRKFIKKCKKIIGYGHDLGLHNNCFTNHLNTNHDLKAILKKPLDFLRKNGIEICGTSCHGDRLCYNADYYNYEIWKEFDSSKNEMLNKRKFDKVSLNDLGLLYEANFLDYEFYLSDSGGKWRGIVIDKKKPKYFERSLAKSKENIGVEAVSEFKKAESGVFQILTHPCWWDIVCLRNIFRRRNVSCWLKKAGVKR